MIVTNTEKSIPNIKEYKKTKNLERYLENFKTNDMKLKLKVN